MFEIHDSVKDLAGSTPTRRLIISRALEYLDSLAHDAGGNIALQRELATAYEKIGDIQGNPYSANIGDTDGALTSYRKALQIRESFKPVAATTDAQMELGRSHRSLGDIMEQKGDIEQTVREYRRSLLIFSQLAESEPKNPAVQDELARAYETLADGLGRTANGDAERLTTYKKSLAIREELLRQDNSNSKRQRAVAINLMKIGDVSDPHDPDAILSMRKGVVIFESLAAADPNNGRARREVGWGYYKLGGMLIAAEDYPGAVDSLQKSVAIREKSAVADPQNAQASFDLASTCVDLADALSTTGDTAQAVTQARRGIAIVTALLAADPTNAIYSRNLATYHNKLGDVFARSGADKNAAVTERLRAWSEARSSYEKAHEIFSDLQAHGTLPPADAAEQPKEFARRMSDCQEAIKRLAAANSSP
jgi:tetratricopeptide (TPR) repeat protein